jgi:hypothetical protein
MAAKNGFLHEMPDGKDVDDFLMQLGRVVLNFSTLESTLATTISALITAGKHETAVGEIITCELSFKNLTGLLSSLVRQKSGDAGMLSALEAMMAKCLQAEEARNVLMHSAWKRQPDSDMPIRSKTTAKLKGLKRVEEEITPAKIAETADLIKAACYDAKEFFFRITGARRP